MAGKLIKIKSEGNDTLRKLVNDLDVVDLINQKQIEGVDNVNLDEKWSPEQWYAELRKRWYFHNMSWYMIQETPNNEACPAGIGCNPKGCVEQCFFYTEEGRIEYSQIQEAIEGLNKFPGIQEARQTLEQELKELQESLEKSNKNKNNNPAAAARLKETKPVLFKVLEGKPFWIWHRHLHLQQFLMTQKKCCFNHIIGEPVKNGILMPIF
jgi:hypothetical protein